MATEETKSLIGRIVLYSTIIGAIAGSIQLYSSLKTFKKCPDLQGTWKITFKVNESSYKPYFNDEYIYEVYVTQAENTISGTGEQKLYNGNYAKKHFKMEWPKTNITDKINIAYTLHATRETNGMMVLEIDPNDNKHLKGAFHGAAASVRGLVDIEIK